MGSFIIEPYDREAKVAKIEVRKSLENRRYTHYVRVHGKEQKGGCKAFSHMDISTTPKDGYYTPQQWLEIANNPRVNIFNKGFVQLSPQQMGITL